MRRLSVFMYSLSAFFALCFVGGAFGQEISLVPASGTHFGAECLVPVNVLINTQGKTVSATDLMIESSLEYADFVPGNMLPYFLPPITRSNGLLHIVGFSVGAEQRVQGSGVLGTLYMKGKAGATDGALRIYFTHTGDTTDSNLSQAGGVDVLQSVQNLDVVFDQAACVHAAADLSGGFAGKTYEDSLKETLLAIQAQYPDHSWKTFYAQHTVLVISSFLLLFLLLLVLVIYRKKIFGLHSSASVGQNLSH